VHVPFIISWPRGIASQGEIRSQYHHVNDVVPTLLELLHIAPPTEQRGVAVKPIEGTSFAYSLTDAKAPGRKHEQYYELEANRGYYADGWKLVAFRAADQRFDQAPWELYHLTDDFSEAHDLAAEHPEKIKELEAKWWSAARKYQVLPLIDVALLERPRYSKFMSVEPPEHRVLPAGAATVPQYVAPVLPGRSYSISAEIERQSADQAGVIVAQGDQFSGYALYVRNNRLVYERNIGSDVVRMTSSAELPIGKATLEFRYEKVSTGLAVARGLLGEGVDFNRLSVLAGMGSLWVSGRKVAEAKIPQPFMVAWEGLDVGRDAGSPVSPIYAADAPFAFAGKLQQVTYQLR
jgi:arylsulfatase